MIIFAKICISIRYKDFITQNVQPAEKRNSVFDLLDRISGAYENKKGLPLSEAVPLCGFVTNYLTFIEDFQKVLDFIEWYRHIR